MERTHDYLLALGRVPARRRQAVASRTDQPPRLTITPLMLRLRKNSLTSSRPVRRIVLLASQQALASPCSKDVRRHRG
jgi:hypothetical protein